MASTLQIQNTNQNALKWIILIQSNVFLSSFINVMIELKLQRHSAASLKTTAKLCQLQTEVSAPGGDRFQVAVLTYSHKITSRLPQTSQEAACLLLGQQ